MNKKKDTCFVCGEQTGTKDYSVNPDVLLPVCNNCKGSEKEKTEVSNLLDSLADGFICGCI